MKRPEYLGQFRGEPILVDTDARRLLRRGIRCEVRLERDPSGVTRTVIYIRVGVFGWLRIGRVGYTYWLEDALKRARHEAFRVADAWYSAQEAAAGDGR